MPYRLPQEDACVSLRMLPPAKYASLSDGADHPLDQHPGIRLPSWVGIDPGFDRMAYGVMSGRPAAFKTVQAGSNRFDDEPSTTVATAAARPRVTLEMLQRAVDQIKEAMAALSPPRSIPIEMTRAEFARLQLLHQPVQPILNGMVVATIRLID